MWQLQKQKARLQLESFSASVDLLRPDLGLQEINLPDGPFPQAKLLRIQLTGGPIEEGETILESYVRDSDLIVRYDKRKDRPLESSIYWRGVTDDAVCGVELVVSLQTDLLDSEAGIQCTSEIPAVEVVRLIDADTGRFETLDLAEGLQTVEPGDGAGLFLFRLTDRPFSYAEMTHPSDFEATALMLDIEDENLVMVSNVLFHGQHLEKGVIRRGRLQGFFIPRENDEAAALKHYQQFAASAPPLTT